MDLIRTENLVFSYGENLIIDHLSFSVESGDFFALAGANGSGKSSLIKLIIGDLKRDGGEICLFDQSIDDFSEFDRIGYLSQINNSKKISFPLTSREFVMVNLHKNFRLFPDRKTKERVDKVFKDLDISNLLDREFRSLSGGQQQRVMLARALVKNPELLILDEPTVGIDKENKEKLLDILLDFNKKGGTILVVSHEMDLISPIASKIAKLEDGSLIHA